MLESVAFLCMEGGYWACVRFTSACWGRLMVFHIFFSSLILTCQENAGFLPSSSCGTASGSKAWGWATINSARAYFLVKTHFIGFVACSVKTSADFCWVSMWYTVWLDEATPLPAAADETGKLEDWCVDSQVRSQYLCPLSVNHWVAGKWRRAKGEQETHWGAYALFWFGLACHTCYQTSCSALS